MANKQNVIFDGGSNMQIRFVSTGGSQFDPSIYFSESANNSAMKNITFYRTRWHVAGMGTEFSTYAAFTNLSFINSEFDALGSSDTGNQHHIYISLYGTGDGRVGNGLKILNNIDGEFQASFNQYCVCFYGCPQLRVQHITNFQ